MASITSRLRSGFNAFVNDEEQVLDRPAPLGYGMVSSIPPQRSPVRMANERSIISSIYATMGLDLATLTFRHTQHDDTDRYENDRSSGLNECLRTEANIDQAAQAFMLDVALTLFGEGTCVIVPVDTTIDPMVSGSYDIQTMRVGRITQWYPTQVRAEVYNDRKGIRQEILLNKSTAAVIDNPLYTVMNAPNSTLQRLIRKLALLDSIDEAAGSGKLDMIIQLPYVIKSEARREQAEQRRADIEYQLKGSQYGIAYTDGTEKITQLNRPIDNNLVDQIQMLITLLYSQLGITPEIMNGTAPDAVMANYYTRTIEPFANAIVEGMRRTFLTKTARTQGQSIDYFRDPLKLVPVSAIADIADKLARNEILTSNEIRQALGYKPSNEPKADQLINSNMPVEDTGVGTAADPNATPDPNAPADPNVDASVAPTDSATATTPAVDNSVSAGSFDDINAAISHIFSSLGIEDAPDLTAGADASQTLDPDVMLAALDQIEASANQAFSGLGLPDGT